MFYVYLHKKKTTGEVFYVGKGKGRRINDNSRRNASWKQVVESCGIIREYYLTGLQEWYALELEADLIAYYGLLIDGSGTLVNLLSKDERPAGRRYLSGIASPRADKEKHLFRNLKSGEEFSGTRYEFQDKYKPKKHFVNHLFIEGNTVSNDWIVVDRFSEEEYKTIVDNYNNPNRRKDQTKYTFCNIFSGEELHCTTYEFSTLYDIKESTIRTYLCSARNKTYTKLTIKRKWYIKEVVSENALLNMASKESFLKSKTLDKTIYTFINIKTKEEFSGTRFDFKIKYKYDPVHLLKKGRKNKTLHGWCVPTLLEREDFEYLMETGGVDRFLGKGNPNMDKNIYSFINDITNEEFKGTRKDFIKKYSIDITPLFSKTRNRLSVKNWKLNI